MQKSGERNPQWKGGITPQGLVLRQPLMERRSEIYARDEWRCRLCGQNSNELTLHHVLPVWARPDLADEEANVVSLCRPCHLSVNGRELQYVERLGRALREIPADARPPRARGNVLTARSVRIRSITVVGEQMTYDLEMEDPHHNFVANGIVTHNSQLSQRYVDESGIGFVLPPEIEDGSPEFETWRQACRNSLASYRELLAGVTEKVGDAGPATMRKKRARQAARAVLPNSAETKIVVTGNARAWRHFCEMRGAGNADLEIRRLAGAVLRTLQQEAPSIFGDMRFVPSPDGIDTIETDYSKV